MLQNNITKKSLLFILFCFFVAGIVFAQASGSTTELHNRYLQKADEQYSAMQYEEAFKTINAALELYGKDEIPGMDYIFATQIYTKLLEKMAQTKDFTYFNDVVMNLQTYPKINDDPKIQKFLREVQQQQDELTTKSKTVQETAESLTVTPQESNQQPLLLLVLILAAVILVLLIVIIVIKASSKKSVSNTQSAQQSKKFCTNCGAELNTSTKFCPNCGASL